jgi:DNA-directed RNA polymerase specialized sigma24 family protein
MDTTKIFEFVNGHLWFAIKTANCYQDAQDVIQDVAIRIFDRAEWFASLPEREKKNYVMYSIKNRVIDLFRMRKRRYRYTDLFEDAAVTRPEVYAKLDLEDVIKKGNERPLIFDTLMLQAEGYKVKEIADAQGHNVNTVLGRCRYAREYLKR